MRTLGVLGEQREVGSLSEVPAGICLSKLGYFVPRHDPSRVRAKVTIVVELIP